MLTMIDLEMGNLGSVRAAWEMVGVEVHSTQRPDDVERAEAVLLPGVGAFGDGMEKLRDFGLVEALRRHVARRRPLLGICLGMQLLAQRSTEHGAHDGLGFIPGEVVRLQPSGEERVPNMGWCDVSFSPPRHALFARLPPSEPFYFAHSYHLECARAEDRVATIQYGNRTLTAAIAHENIFGFQFHPEKSQDAGLDVLHAFASRLLAPGQQEGTRT